MYFAMSIIDIASETLYALKLVSDKDIA